MMYLEPNFNDLLYPLIGTQMGDVVMSYLRLHNMVQRAHNFMETMP